MLPPLIGGSSNPPRPRSRPATTERGPSTSEDLGAPRRAVGREERVRRARGRRGRPPRRVPLARARRTRCPPRYAAPSAVASTRRSGRRLERFATPSASVHVPSFQGQNGWRARTSRGRRSRSCGPRAPAPTSTRSTQRPEPAFRSRSSIRATRCCIGWSSRQQPGQDLVRPVDLAEEAPDLARRDGVDADASTTRRRRFHSPSSSDCTMR